MSLDLYFPNSNNTHLFGELKTRNKLIRPWKYEIRKWYTSLFLIKHMILHPYHERQLIFDTHMKHKLLLTSTYIYTLLYFKCH